LKGDFSLAKASDFLTKDDQIFKTILDMTGVNSKSYDLEQLLQAERRVHNGTNKTIKTALNSIASLKRGNKKESNNNSSKDIQNVEFDEFGLSEDIYTQQQIKFIRERIQDLQDNNNISSSYQRQGVIRMAKLESTITELEALNAMSRGMDKDLMDNLKKANDMYAKVVSDMKLTPRQANDGEKGEDAFANAVIAYDEKFRFESFQFEDLERREGLAELIISNADKIVQLINGSSTFFHFKKSLAETVDLKAADIQEIGEFTIEDLFEFKKIHEDRKIVVAKNEFTRNPDFVDREAMQEEDDEE
jgi:uncharacterized protein YerC